ncbi:L,D-transpeptidase family protein [Salinimonas lutimaris]|uniref:L,D-transpeptidase family protein n=1 Tax=Salinimonas lutimaris TaxID=914153 RepID=UPI0010BFDA54|nr:L,D-transpeptidase family protein [Salinimonas lutimaris]
MKAVMVAILLCLSLSAGSRSFAAPPNLPLQTPIWFDGPRLSLSGIELLSLMADLGMRDAGILSQAEARDIATTDTYLTRSLLAINHIVIGHQVSQYQLTLPAIVQAHHNNRLTELIDQQLPRFADVLALRAAISKFRQLARVTWPEIPVTFTPRLGQRHHHIGSLIFMLKSLGDYTAPHTSQQHSFTPAVQQALRRFQARHGLPQSGMLNELTRQRLSLPPAARLSVLQQNLYRLLSLPSLPPSRYITVNIPEFTLSYIAHRQTIASMPVVVGTPFTPTPVMLTEIDRITQHPQWVPTASIVKGELLSALDTSPGWLAQQGFHWVSRRDPTQRLPLQAGLKDPRAQYKTHLLVQRPGASNALGQWRFNIKNHDAIYLHDTPQKQFFSHQNRALSHGCIRLAEPGKLAQLILADAALTHNNNQTRHYRLAEPIPVYINYQTVVVRQNRLIWLKDIYQVDVTDTPFHQRQLTKQRTF